MAGDITRVVGALWRTAPASIAGAPTSRALYNRTGSGSAASSEGLSSTRHGEIVSTRPRDFWGSGVVEGKVSIEGTPAARKVRLFDVLTGLLVAEAWSRKDGQYRLDFLDPSRDYFVFAHDHLGQFNAVIADWVKPEPTVYP